MDVTFTGRQAHAATDPWEGLNALDAMVMLLNGIAMWRQQLRPDAIRILTAEEAKRLEAAPGLTPAAALRPPECLQAGLFDDVQAAALRRALESALPAGAWQLEPAREPPRWIVYMGKYPSVEALAKKRAELAALDFRIEALSNPALEFGLSLGGFDTEAAADAELAALTRRGVRTARVVQERSETRGVLLKIAAADEVTRARLDDLKLALAGKVLRACK